jgi:DNA ligase (NAD+)
MDGLAISLTYIDGKFAVGATRGDGFKGENITRNLKTIKSIPLSLPEGAPAKLDVRGEVFMPHAGFTQVEQGTCCRGIALFANPRNAAAGSGSPARFRYPPPVRPLDVFYLYAGLAEGTEIPETHWEALDYLQSLGFK